MYGIQASRKGYDLADAENNELIVSSSYNTLKIVQEYSDTLTLSASELDWAEETETVTHNLGYKPIVLLYYKEPSISRWVQGPSVIPGSAASSPIGYYVSATYEHTSDNAFDIILEYFRDIGDPASINMDYKLFLLLEPREDAWYD